MKHIFTAILEGAERRERSRAFAASCPEPGLTVQSEKDNADINVIVKRFGVTGQVPVGVRRPTYGDFTSVGDFKEAMNAIRAAEESFMEMPANVRKRFNHDPAEFVAFCSDEKNLDEMRKLGLAVAAKEPEPEKVQKVEVVNAPASEKK